jgi:hypothetical protein
VPFKPQVKKRWFYRGEFREGIFPSLQIFERTQALSDPPPGGDKGNFNCKIVPL